MVRIVQCGTWDTKTPSDLLKISQGDSKGQKSIKEILVLNEDFLPKVSHGAKRKEEVITFCVFDFPSHHALESPADLMECRRQGGSKEGGGCGSNRMTHQGSLGCMFCPLTAMVMKLHRSKYTGNGAKRTRRK